MDNSPPSLTVSADDTFDKLFEKKSKPADPFDKLFEKVNDKAIDANPVFDRLFDDIPNPSVVHQHCYNNSVFSSPSETEVSTDNSNQAGLFSSFTKVDNNTPKLKKKSQRNVRTKKKPDKKEYKPRDNILSETLDVQVVFENEISPKEVIRASKVSSLATIQSPVILRAKTLTALSVATSTPVLASRSSNISLSGKLLVY